MAEQRRRRYGGELAKPIVWHDPPTFWGAVTKKRVRQFWRDYKRQERETEEKVSQTLLHKMSLLMKHHNIADEDDAWALAWALAYEHVPSFKIVPEKRTKRGRRKEWHGGKLSALHEAVQTVKNKHNFNDRQALKFISKNSEWVGTWGPPANYTGSQKQWIETLESRLQDAKRYVSWIDSSPRKAIEDARADALRKKFRKS